MSPFEFLRRCSFQRHFALAKLSLTFGQEIAKRDTLIRMDSYRPVEELGHFPPESEELLKYYSPTSLKRNQHGASICRNLLLAGLGLIGCLELIFLLVFLLRSEENRHQTSKLLGELNGIVPECE